MSDCVFCKIVAGQIPSIRVYEDDEVLAFMDIGQVNPGHVLVAVKRHAENLYALDVAQASAASRARFATRSRPQDCRYTRRMASPRDKRCSTITCILCHGTMPTACSLRGR